jgi:altronate dehydratase small subunit
MISPIRVLSKENDYSPDMILGQELIEKERTFMTKYAKLIDQNDNVITVVADCKAGDEVTVKYHGKEIPYNCNSDIPFGHKIAIKHIKMGGPIIKYGEVIGSAKSDIKPGDWVHIHNVQDDYLCLDKDGNPLPGQ